MRPAALALAAALVLSAAIACVGVAAAALAPGQRLVLDDFEDVSRWEAHPASGVRLAITSDRGVHGRAMRLDFGFTGGGYAVVRRRLDVEMPENYRIRFAVRGECLPNDLELKLLDPSGDNVWWHNRRGFAFPAAWDSLGSRKRQITFAWGPQGGGELKRLGAIEFAVTAGSGGTGSVWIDDLVIEALPPAGAAPPAPKASASSAEPRRPATLSVDGDSSTVWASRPGDPRPAVTLDLGVDREFGGLVIDWLEGKRPRDYVVELGSGAGWSTVRRVLGGDGGRDHLRLPESETRRVRIRATGGVPAQGIAIREIQVQPLAWGESMNALYEAIARDAPRGRYPRGMSGEQVYWTVVGVPGDRAEGLLSEDGAFETGKARFSIEPFVWANGRRIGWSDTHASQRLGEGRVQTPSVRWIAGDVELVVTPEAVGAPGASGARIRYTVSNLGAGRVKGALFLAVRPFQVNPPAQFLNTTGGYAPIRTLAREAGWIHVDGTPAVRLITAPAGFGAATFDRGDVVGFLDRGRLPPWSRADDPEAAASGAVSYPLDLGPGASREIVVLVPLRGVVGDAAPPAEWESPAEPWIELPDSDVAATLRAQVRWIHINRDSAGIQPGSRAYERSWIRDGALTSAALLQMGQADAARDFMEWFAGYQYPDGKVPCCVDHRGADPVPEHDSHGELIYLVAEYWRYTGDRGAVERLWPAVARAAAYMDTLRATRRGPEWRLPATRAFYGLLPPSISHEGYSAKPMHSYWDDFFAWRGYRDAAFLAGVLGRRDEQRRLAASRDQFGRDLAASVRAAMAAHRIDYVPGCADLGDFDATSTTIALSPTGVEPLLPRGALERTFERYWEFFRARREGRVAWEAFTPYEIRNIGAFVRLGWRERAKELLEYFMSYRRPAGWAQWSEVVWHDDRTPKFLGDLPHTWVGSDFVRSVLDMLAYARERDQALVLGAGVPWTWVSNGAGVRVHRLPTPYGVLGYTMRAHGDTVEVRIEDGVRVPRGGILVDPPSVRAFRRVSVDGAVTNARRVVVRRVPATVVFAP